MKPETGLELLQNFITEAEEVKDPYFLVHFSREDDKYKGYHNFLDTVDALIIIKHILKEFNINPKHLKGLDEL